MLLSAIILITLIIIGIYLLYKIIDFIKFCIADNGGEEIKRYITDEERRYYYTTLNEIMKMCWNKDTCVFSWDIWLDKRDEVICCGDESVLKTIDYDLRSYGRLQIFRINACLENCFQCGSNIIREDMVIKLKNMQNDIIFNLGGMYAYENGVHNPDNCPEEVRIYRKSVYSLLIGEIDWTRENIKKIVELGNYITDSF